MNIKDPIEEKSELVIEALRYAHNNNLDINKIEDVETVLNNMNIENEDTEEFMKLLQNADAFLEMNAKELEKKSDLPN